VRSLLAVPLIVEGKVIGVLEAGAVRIRRFSRTDLAFLQIVADRVAPAIDRARLYDAVRRSQEDMKGLSQRLIDLQEEERGRIAQELHDEVGQILTGLGFLLDRVGNAVTGSPESRTRGDIESAQGLVRDLLARVRDMSMNLRPTVLDNLGLVAALLWHFDRFTLQCGVRVLFRHSGVEGRLSPRVETSLYRIVQEALTNVARHSAASDVRVALIGGPGRLRLSVKDTGSGFDPALMPGTSNGMAGMRERARLLDGRLVVRSSPGHGTRIVADLPLPADVRA